MVAELVHERDKKDAREEPDDQDDQHDGDDAGLTHLQVVVPVIDHGSVAAYI